MSGRDGLETGVLRLGALRVFAATSTLLGTLKKTFHALREPEIPRLRRVSAFHEHVRKSVQRIDSVIGSVNLGRLLGYGAILAGKSCVAGTRSEVAATLTVATVRTDAMLTLFTGPQIVALALAQTTRSVSRAIAARTSRAAGPTKPGVALAFAVRTRAVAGAVVRTNRGHVAGDAAPPILAGAL